MLVDHHCHLDFPEFAPELDQVVARAREAGVGTLVTISTRIRKFDEVKAVAERFDDVFCSVGTHPHNAHEELDIPVERIVELSTHPKVVAIGEAGLDYHYKHSTPEAQAEGFRRTSRRRGKRGCRSKFIRATPTPTRSPFSRPNMRREHFRPCSIASRVDGNLPCGALDLGLYVSFSGVITFKNSEALREIARDGPLDRVLVETDAPFLAPLPFRGKRNEPAFVVRTAAALASIKGVTADEIAHATTENFFRLYSKAKRPFAPQPAGPRRHELPVHDIGMRLVGRCAAYRNELGFMRSRQIRKTGGSDVRHSSSARVQAAERPC